MSSKSNLKLVHNRNLEKADAYLELLKLAGTTEAGQMAAALSDGIDETTIAVDSAHNSSVRIKGQQQAFREADKKLKSTVAGTYAVIEASDPALAAKLPPEEVWVELGGGQQAEHLIAALQAAGKDAKPYIQPLTVVLKMWQGAAADLAKVGNSATALHSGNTAIAKLRMLIAQADVLLRTMVQPGTPLFAMLKKARGTGGPKKGSSKPKKDAGATPSAQPANSASHPAASAQPTASTQPAASQPSTSPSTPASTPSTSASAISGETGTGSEGAAHSSAPTGSTVAELPIAPPPSSDSVVTVGAGASGVVNGVHA